MAAVSCISAAAGVVVAKLWTESEANEMDQRLEEVKRQALERSPAGIDPVVAVRHLLETLDWSLANAGQHRLQSASDIVRECLNSPLREDGATQALGDSPHEELGRHLRKVRHLCSAPSRKRAPELRPQVHARRAGAPSTGGSGSSGSTYDPEDGGTIHDKLGLCAALSYVVYEFLKLQHAARGCLQDTPRKSLRLALASLAQHATFAKGRTLEWLVPCQMRATKGNALAESWWRQFSCPEKDFRTAAVTLICILDAALSWSPLDLFGWMGKPEDVEGRLLARQRDRCVYPAYASKLRACLKAACSASPKTVARIESHLAAIKSRDLPKPWVTAWVRVQGRDSGPMIFRNKTKVPLRLELHSSAQSLAWPMSILQSLAFGDRWVLAAHVQPGIEKALRLKKELGSEFQLHVHTASGVRVCSRQLCRGEAFDFQIDVPTKPAQLRNYVLSRTKTEHTDVSSASCTSRRLSQASTASTASSVTTFPMAAPSWPQPILESTPIIVDGFTSCICPRCLERMTYQVARPRLPTYAGGVSCDHCQTQLLGEEGLDAKMQTSTKKSFCHCSRCQFDLCRLCAYKEMQQVWWKHH